MKEMSEVSLLKIDEDISKERPIHYFQVDALKAIMIFLVIFDHTVSWGVKSEIGVALWERICIPVFLVIMGFNMGLSFQRSGALTLRELYSKSYFKGKILRYVIPFLLLYLVSTIVGLFMYDFNFVNMYNEQYSPHWGPLNLFTGILLFWGPGNWFIPVILQSILILPILYKGFTKKPVLTLILCFIIELAMQLIVFTLIGEVTSLEEGSVLGIMMTSVLFYLSAVGLGMWFSFGYKLRERRNLFIWILFPISLTYLIIYQFFGFRLMINGIPLLRGDYHFLVFPYSAFLFLLVMMVLPKKSEGRFARKLSLIGKSTYHILLTQILGYGFVVAYYGTHYSINVGFTLIDLLNLLFAWMLFISFGVRWYKIDQIKNFKRRVIYSIALFTIFISILWFLIVIL